MWPCATAAVAMACAGEWAQLDGEVKTGIGYEWSEPEIATVHTIGLATENAFHT